MCGVKLFKMIKYEIFTLLVSFSDQIDLHSPTRRKFKVKWAETYFVVSEFQLFYLIITCLWIVVLHDKSKHITKIVCKSQSSQRLFLLHCLPLNISTLYKKTHIILYLSNINNYMDSRSRFAIYSRENLFPTKKPTEFSINIASFKSNPIHLMHNFAAVENMSKHEIFSNSFNR